MKISAKGRYGLASMIYIEKNVGSEGCINLLKIAEDLGISKIYLEQVFALLKKADLVVSIKGSSGGYQLSRSSEKITAFDILNAIELTLFEKTEPSLSENASYIENTLETIVWDPLDEKVKSFLSKISLSDLAVDATKNQQGNDYMYFI